MRCSVGLKSQMVDSAGHVVHAMTLGAFREGLVRDRPLRAVSGPVIDISIKGVLAEDRWIIPTPRLPICHPPIRYHPSAICSQLLL